MAQYSTDKQLVQNRYLRLVYRLCAVLCVALGIAGAFLPLLPTTPFLLLALFFSCRSSPRIYHWLIQHPDFGPPLARYMRDRAISVRLYWRAAITMWLSISLAIWLVTPVVLKIMLFCIAVSVTLYMTRLMKRGQSHALREHKNHQ